MARTNTLNNGAVALGFEAKLWAAADALRGSMDAAEYKHVCLGLLFLKYISDAFEAKHAELQAQKAEGADPEDLDEPSAASTRRLPTATRSHNDRHPDLKADYVLANPPFNDSDWRGELPKDDKRWAYDTRRPRATPTTPGCTSSTTWRPSGSRASCSPTARSRRMILKG